MSDTTALDTDVITEASNHNCVGMAVSVCTTPAAPSPLPMPYPTTGSMSEGSIDPCMRTKIDGAPIVTVGSCMKTCHGNEPGTLKEVVSLNTTGPTFPVMGAPTVLIELGMAGITGSPGQMNKAITVGAPANASDASGTGGAGGGGGGGGGGAGGPNGPGGPGGGGGGGGGSADGASANGAPGQSSGPDAEHQCQDGHPVDVVSGAVVDEQVDFELPGPVPVVWRRVYSSRRSSDVDATLGRGWAHAYEQTITVHEGCVTLRDADGRYVYFEKIGVGEQTFHRRERLTLHRDAPGRWRLYAHATRRTSTFDAPSEEKPARLLFLGDAWGNSLTFEYDGERLARIVDTAGREVVVSWRNGRITQVDVQRGGQTLLSVSYGYTRAGCLAEAVDAAGHADRFEYDEQHRMVATTIKRGVRFAYAWADDGRCTGTWGPDGLYAINFRHDPSTHTTWVEGEEPRIIQGNGDGQPLRELLPDGTLLEERAYDDDGYLIAKANGAGEGEQYWYDARGNRVRVLDAQGAETRWEYDERDLPVRRTGPDGLVTEYHHDERGAMTGVVFATGDRWTLSYDGRGRMTEIADARGRVWSFEYDAANNLVSETDARGARTTFGYDALGRAVQRTDALGRSTRVEYDQAGNVRSRVLPDGTTVRYEREPGGKVLRETDALGRTTTKRFGGMGVITELVGPDRQKWRFTYTSKERLAEIVNPLGETYSFTYDQVGRVVEETTFDGMTFRYAYSRSGRLARVDYPDGSSRDLSFDRRGNLVADRGSDGTKIEVVRDRMGQVAQVSATDARGDVTSTTFERDRFGRVVVERHGQRAVRCTYDVFGRRTARILPNDATTTYAYDGMDALVELTHGKHRTAFERDVLGREGRRSDADGIVSLARAYDARDRLVAQRVVAPSPGENVPRVLVERRWEYDAVGRATRVEDSRLGVTEYRYDAVDRLARVVRGASGEAFGYDAAGSLVSALEGLAVSGGARWKVAAGNRLTATSDARYEYDARGRRTEKKAKDGSLTRYEWDVRDRLTGVVLADGTCVRSVYDGFGRRVRKEVVPAGAATPSRTTEYVWDANALAMEADSMRSDRVFVHEPGTLVPLLHVEQGETFYYVNDNLGTPKELVDRAGRVVWAATHSAWGRIVDVATEGGEAKKVESPFRLLGQVADDDTGLCWTRFRCFDPDVGRWLSPDPLAWSGGPNLYAFAGSPTDQTDELGLMATGPGHGKERTEPTLPPRVIAEEGGVTVQHNYRSNDHGPAHAHVTGGGPETKIGANGKPLDGEPTPTAQQQAVIDNNLPAIRRAVNKCGRWLDHKQWEEEQASEGGEE